MAFPRSQSTAAPLKHFPCRLPLAHRWWGEYASRKNDEEEEHVADSLLYDERKHLPRTVQRPDCVTAPMGKQ